MASVKIDLGFGEYATLSERTASGVVTAKHQRDADEFLRRWPRTRSIEQESSYLRQLGLHLGQSAPGVNPSDTSARIRAAVKSGKVMVVIERAAQTGGGVRGSGPTTPPYPLAMREKTAWVAPTRTPTRSYQPPRYDDVSADDLINYIQSVLGSAPAVVAAPDSAPSMSLADAQPFEYAEDLPDGNVEELAASTNNPNYAAKMLGYDRSTFSEMLHRFKPDNGLGPADNVIWHDNGDVYFQDNYIANFHDWAN
jgi:hypothetical protein